MANAKDRIAKNEAVGVQAFFVSLPLLSVHTHPLIGIARRMNNEIRQQIQQYVNEGITNVKVIKKCLRKYVLDHCSDKVNPLPDDRSYYPTNKDIINCVHANLSETKYSNFDQVQLEQLVDKWKKSCMTGTKYFFRQCTVEATGAVTPPAMPCKKKPLDAFVEDDDTDDDDGGQSDCDGEGSSDSSEGSTFLFVHQEQWQRQLLCKYGNTLALLDATYKTTKYQLPLFLLCVRTNCCYIPVAEFIVERETSHLISEALQIIAQWNENWKPPFFMVDYSKAELYAISAAFPNSEVYLCDFHREQAWQRWIRSGECLIMEYT